MFKKFMAVTATLAIAATMSVSAFAADYKPTDSAISVTPSTTPTDATQYTVMLFKTEADVATATAVASATPASMNDIYYINQSSDLTTLVNGMLVKATTVDGTTTYLPEGNYVVRIGNDKGSVENLVLTVSAETVTPEEPQYYYGDVNASGGYPDLSDAMEVLNYYLWKPSVLDAEEAWRMELANVSADRETNSTIDLIDAMEILNYYLWKPSTLDTLIPLE